MRISSQKISIQVNEAKTILSILLVGRQHKDKWIWHYNIAGKYMVASGYHLAMELVKMEAEKGECSEDEWL